MTLTPDEQARYQQLADQVEAEDYEPNTINAHLATPEEDAAFQATLDRLTGKNPTETPKPATLDNNTDTKE